MGLTLKHDERRASPRYEPAIATICKIAPQGDYRNPVNGLPLKKRLNFET